MSVQTGSFSHEYDNDRALPVSTGFLRKCSGSGGFTLIEVIVSLVVAALLGTLLVNFISGTVAKSVQPVLQAQQGSYLYSIMENMTADYNNLFLADDDPLDEFQDRVGDEDTTQTRYSEDGHEYTVVRNRRISFDGAGTTVTEQTDSSGKILKVTINYRGLSLTSLFSE
ncbi:MAG: hypothetical protein AVO39_01820 [delta proteobacterium MLS_D]|jgi:prepilin-type N-terminal cleavage/methylation domain-containing protein|nr:MAG: hypothetical protein AVO39_01820 [delta proteobacterium MLS_D]